MKHISLFMWYKCVICFENLITSNILLYIFYNVDVSELYGTVISARSSLIDLLTTALMGDKLAAEYTLLNLMSTV